MDKNPTLENAIKFFKEIELLCRSRVCLSAKRRDFIANSHHVNNRLFNALVNRDYIKDLGDGYFKFNFIVTDSPTVIALAVDDAAIDHSKSNERVPGEKHRRIHKRGDGKSDPSQINLI